MFNGGGYERTLGPRYRSDWLAYSTLALASLRLMRLWWVSSSVWADQLPSQFHTCPSTRLAATASYGFAQSSVCLSALTPYPIVVSLSRFTSFYLLLIPRSVRSHESGRPVTLTPQPCNCLSLATIRSHSSNTFFRCCSRLSAFLSRR